MSIEFPIEHRQFSYDGEIKPSTVEAQMGLCNPVHQVYFRAGLIAARESLARFVEAQDPVIAASIRANWWPRAGEDKGPPRKLKWNEVTNGLEHDDPDFAERHPDEVTPTLEALPIALGFLAEAHLTPAEAFEESHAPIVCRSDENTVRPSEAQG